VTWFQHQQQLLVPHGSTATYTLPGAGGRTPLERLTFWAVSGARSMTSMSFQVKINGNNYGSAVVINARPAFDAIMTPAGTSGDDNLMWPVPKAVQALPPGGTASGIVDDFQVTVVISNGGGADQYVTIYAVALDHAPRG